MFERYTEKARRAIFFARHEASQFGADHIETEHILLGLLRADIYLFRHFLPKGTSEETIRRKIEAVAPPRQWVSTSVDMPISTEGRDILTYAAEEAERLADKDIDTKHLLLGILREEKCFAAELLRELGLRLPAVREVLAKPQEVVPVPPSKLEVDAEESGFDQTVATSGLRPVNIEFMDEAKGRLVGLAQGFVIPQIGTDVLLGDVAVRVTRVTHLYTRTTVPAQFLSEGDRFLPQKIVVYVQARIQ